jgi:murein DD-endopeptidase MepM/ murein hydrolase activator NlpD
LSLTNQPNFGKYPLINSLVSRANALLSFASQSLQQHPKRITAVVAALMLGGGGGAFALASIEPDAAEVVVQQVTETVEPLAVSITTDVGTLAFNLFRSETTRATDTPATLLKRLGVNDLVAVNFLRTDETARLLLEQRGRNVTAEASDTNTLVKLTSRWSNTNDNNFKRLVIERTPKGFQSRVETAALTSTSKLASGTIRSTLFAATDDADIPDAVATQLTEIFSGDIDFHRSLHKGDRFSVVYETLEADGEPVRTGRILSAEFVNRGKTSTAMWFQDPMTAGKGAYFTLDGQSLRHAFLASPVEFSRVSSGFQMRVHPISGIWKAHLGVDYAAPTGTPVRTIGDGTVVFAGVQNGFGNVVMVDHGKQQTTVYAHLSKINVRTGETLAQGQNIGAIGSTGWATGPHLHFEFRVNGVHQDPLTLAQANGGTTPVSGSSKALFGRLAEDNRVALAAARVMRPANAE